MTTESMGAGMSGGPNGPGAKIPIWFSAAAPADAMIWRDIGPLPWFALLVSLALLTVFGIEVWLMWFKRPANA